MAEKGQAEFKCCVSALGSSPLALFAFAVSFVFARPSLHVVRRPMSVTAAFTRAVHFRFAVPRETNRTEHDSAFVANFTSEESAIRKTLVAFLHG
jgi:hypothetical protein